MEPGDFVEEEIPISKLPRRNDGSELDLWGVATDSSGKDFFTEKPLEVLDQRPGSATAGQMRRL